MTIIGFEYLGDVPTFCENICKGSCCDSDIIKQQQKRLEKYPDTVTPNLCAVKCPFIKRKKKKTD